MTAVVTGASGHLGVNLIADLLARGENVRAVVHRNLAPLEDFDIERVTGDVLDVQSLEAAFAGADVVYHLAAIISIAGDPDGSVRAVNVQGADNAARAALGAGVRRFVHCSSIHAFDLAHIRDVVDETSARIPEGSAAHPAYDLSKADGERRVRSWFDRGLDGVVIHPTGVIGPHDPEPSRMGRVFLSLHERTMAGLIAGSFDFVDVRDVVDGIIEAAGRGRAGESYLLPGRRMTIRSLAQIAESVTGVSPPRFTSPMWAARMGAPFIEWYARRRGTDPLYTSESLAALRTTAHIDGSLATRDLGFSARPIEDTVRDIYQWFSDSGAISMTHAS
ncbi:NAD-dependent epimerase/dehydratase family protein [bacterium]|nr:NAD-dependent epimerase/dehydratase family protein [bacterium]